MGITVGCMASPMNVPPVSSGDTVSSGPSQWALTDNDGRRLSLTELKQSIKLPLTEREVFIITKSWKTISRNMTHIGIAMFLRYTALSLLYINIPKFAVFRHLESRLSKVSSRWPTF